MRVHEAKVEFYKKNHMLALVSISATESKLNNNPQLVFYFVDEKNRVFKHCQICKSDTCDFNIRKWFINLGFDMISRDPMDLYVDFNTKELKDTILSKALGRVYWGQIVRRNMKWEQNGKTVKRSFFDVDSILNPRDFSQAKMIEEFKKRSTNPAGSNVYDDWMGKLWTIGDLEKDESAILNFVPTWKMTEEQILGNI